MFRQFYVKNLIKIREKLEEYSFRSIGYILKAIILNIKQDYLDMYKDLSYFMELQNKKKINQKKNNLTEKIEENMFNEKQNNKIQNILNSKKKLLRLGNENIYNSVKESESNLNDFNLKIIKSSNYNFRFKHFFI